MPASGFPLATGLQYIAPVRRRRGYLRQVVVDAARSYFDTNIGDHQHFYAEEDGMLIDIPGEMIEVAGVPAPPKGTSIDRVDVVIRLMAELTALGRGRKNFNLE